ncbi:hypothetical protein V2J09_013614 [Rumex salicifolius]
MPSYDPRTGRLLSEIGKWIPRKWKSRLKHIEILSIHGSDPNPNKALPSDEPRISSLLNALNDYTIKGQLSEALVVFALIRHHVFSSPHSSRCEVLVLPISSLLAACAEDSRLLLQGKQLHSQAVCLGVFRHQYLVRRLVSFYSAYNLVYDAHCVSESSNSMNPLRWNAVISTYVRNGLFKEALSVYIRMLGSGIKPDNFTFSSVLKACGEQMNLSLGREIHREVADSNHKESVYVQNALISMYGKCGEIKVAHELFDKMHKRDVVSWNTLVAVYASKNMWDEASKLFERMLSEVSEKSIIARNTIASGCLQTGMFIEALQLLIKSRRHDIRVDDVGAVVGLTACSHVQNMELGQQFHASAIRSGWDDYHNVKNTLITMYSRCNDLKNAYMIFQLMGHKSLITWNAIISGYSYWDRIDEASFLFREMLLSGFEPNYVTIASILPLCGRVANLQHGREFHCYIVRREQLNGYLVLWNSIIEMYARSGKALHAKKVFDSLSQRNEITYTSLISGYGAQGQGAVALELLKEMEQFGIKPDHITLLAVLSACSHSGLVNQGQLLFDQMERYYGISPRLEHYVCMVDLYGRAGLLWKAAEIIRNMPYQPTPEMWVTLLGGCRIYRNMTLGEWAAENLLKMRPSSSGYYVLVANMYASAGCWNKIADVRTLMRDLGVRKTPGHAWVDLGTGFQSFSASDASDELVGQIYLLLDGMTEQMKDALCGSIEDFLIEVEIVKEKRIPEEDSEEVQIWQSMYDNGVLSCSRRRKGITPVSTVESRFPLQFSSLQEEIAEDSLEKCSPWEAVNPDGSIQNQEHKQPLLLNCKTKINRLFTLDTP